MSLVSAYDVRRAAEKGQRKLAVSDDAVITPQARETAGQIGVELWHGADRGPIPAKVDPERAVQRVLARRSPRWVTPQPRQGASNRKFARISFVGCGMVGATAAHLAAISDMADELLLIDVMAGLAESTALDVRHASGITRSASLVYGGTSLDMVAGSDVVVVTAGRPRSPGTTRAGLLAMNGRVVRDAGEAIGELAPRAVVIVVTNPVDEMTSQLWESSGLPDHQVLGMAGTLDSSRFRESLARAANVRPADVSSVTLGSHGAEMVPVVSSATIKGRPVRSVLSEEVIQKCVKETINGGAAVVDLRKTGSAFIAPAHAVVEVLNAMRGMTVEPVPVSARVHGQYGIEDVFLGVRAQLAMHGVEEIIEERLDETELTHLHNAATSIRDRLAESTASDT